ncbi:MAG: tyrosine-type recombinase/integrase [Gammaproteobacteria bacterium]|nr:tyrosine-type recombinase/integrase [Gammaproteobacteria bacterium]
MKQLPLKSRAFIYVEKAFKEWLDILGYAESTVYYMPVHVREFLSYLEQNDITAIKQITTQQMRDYYNELKRRPNLTRGGGLSNAYLNKHLQALQLFGEYLRKSGRQKLPYLSIKHETDNSKTITILSPSEIKELYKCTIDYNKGTPLEPMNARDRAMLSLIYGCGLRRNEAVHVNVSDIYFDRKLLHVRKGKNYKERMVPISRSDSGHLQNWIYDWRSMLLKEGRKTDALLINQRGRRLGGQSMILRLHILQQRSDDITLQSKEIGLHTLRHSIATHLLQNGMPLEQIQRFLGHSSLESTQIYTHLVTDGNL